MKKTRQELAREQEDAWLDDNLADLAEMGVTSPAKPHENDGGSLPSSFADILHTPMAELDADAPRTPKPSRSKANRDDAVHNCHGE